jgi:hypothetical protein
VHIPATPLIACPSLPRTHHSYEGLSADMLDLVGITHLAERTISTDMEYLAAKVVDTRKADYAVITGVQVRLRHVTGVKILASATKGD